MKGDIYVMESKMNEFIKITEGEKVALIDPVGKVCLGVSKRFADNLDKPEFQEKLFPVWEQQSVCNRLYWWKCSYNPYGVILSRRNSI